MNISETAFITQMASNTVLICVLNPKGIILKKIKVSFIVYSCLDKEYFSLDIHLKQSVIIYFGIGMKRWK